jgi:glucosylceramidase
MAPVLICYWNIALEKGGISRWGWSQNSLITVDTITKTYNYNYEFYLIKHVSQFVKPGAKLLKGIGSFDNYLAFVNPDNSVVIVVQNPDKTEKPSRLPSIKPIRCKAKSRFI